ncbi:molybdopterin-dependent oxidoreductase [Streptosporangium vulgare]|uniref:molybdopterin-dependent oxidoreductase n=1 Tax=Streptosporangium vulgare TaxID=46190 RepID=UPI0031DE9F8F
MLGACPLDCPDTCSWVVTVQDGSAVKMRGNPDHPYTRGALCVKVNRYLEHTRAADRILHPMRRVGPKGSGRFERISWDEALEEISVRLRGIVDEYGGEAIWPYLGTGTLGYVQGSEGIAGRRFWNVLGASRHFLNICSSAGNSGLRQVYGTPGGMDPETFALSRLILLWGTNTLTSGHHLWKFIQDARAAGAHVVAIDPIRTRTAEQADEHLPIRPGTDAALALGLMNVVLAEGAEDRDYLENHTSGWENLREEILRHPPARVAEITGLPEADIRALGTRLARTRPTGIRATMGVQRHAGGGTAMRTIASIPGVTGDWRHPGGGIVYSTSGHVHLNIDTRDDLLPGPVRTLTMTRLADELDESVKCLWVYAANPMGSTSGQNRVRERLLREDLFTVVMEQFPTDHRRLRRHRPARHHADRARRPARGVRAHVPAVERARRRAAGRVPVHHRDVPPPGAAHGAHRAVPVRLRPGAGRAAAHLGAPLAGGDHTRPAAQGGLGPAQRPPAVRAVHRRLPDALRPDGVRLGTGLRPAAHGLGRAGVLPAGAHHTRLHTLPEHHLRQQPPSC